MSDSSESASAARAVRDVVTDAVDAEEVRSTLEGEATAQSVGRDLGSRVGHELGSVLGRELGAVVAADVWKREGPRAILGDVYRRFAELLAALLRNADVGTAVTRLVDLVGTAVSSDAPGGLGGSGADGTSNGAGTETAEAAEDESDTDTGEDSEPATLSSLPADDLEDLREETYRDLLKVMSYRELQSVAKEVGVKANLETDEMIDEIVSEFSGRTAG